MAKGPERDNVNDPFRKGMVAAFPRVHWQRIENSVGAGVPDVNFCLDSLEHWVECKWVPSVSGARFSHPLTSMQCGWISARVHAQGSAWILARRVDTFKLWHGSWAREVLEAGWNAEGECLTMERPWDWVRFVHTLHMSPPETKKRTQPFSFG